MKKIKNYPYLTSREMLARVQDSGDITVTAGGRLMFIIRKFDDLWYIIRFGRAGRSNGYRDPERAMREYRIAPTAWARSSA